MKFDGSENGQGFVRHSNKSFKKLYIEAVFDNS